MKHLRKLFYCFLCLSCLSLLFVISEPIIASDTTNNSDFSYITDYAEILNDTEIRDLTAQCQTISNENGIDILIFTEESIDTSRKQYIEDVYDTMYPTISDAVILLINMDSSDRGVEIQGYGSCEYSISDNRIQNILSTIVPFLSDGEYYTAMQEFIDSAKTYLSMKPDSNYQHTEEDNEAYESTYSDTKPTSFAKKTLVNLFIALGIGAVSVFFMSYNSGGKMTANQNTYLDSVHSRILGRYDRYIRTTTTRRSKPKPPENHSRGGGVSSGGHSHSGGGSSF